MFHVLKKPDILDHCSRTPHLIQFDGGSRGNPGIAGAGCVIYAHSETEPLITKSVYLGTATNNVAEYMGLITGLDAAASAGIKYLHIEGDSKLVIEQVSGKWKVNHPRLKELHAQVHGALNAFNYVAIRHIYRTANSAADKAANIAMDTHVVSTIHNNSVFDYFGNLDYII